MKEHCLLAESSERFGAVHLAKAREAAFGHCLACYRPWTEEGRTIHEKMAAFFDTPAGHDEDLEVPGPGELSRRYFEIRVLLELHTREALHFADSRRFTAARRARKRHRRSVATAPREVGRRVRFSEWDYLALSDEASMDHLLEPRGRAEIDPNDHDLQRAAKRLGIRLY